MLRLLAVAVIVATQTSCGASTVSLMPIATEAAPSLSGPVASALTAEPPACELRTLAPASETPAWRDRIFYQVFVRSFADSNGDGIGDLRGLIDRLDYLNDGDPATDDDLGVTGLWLMPIAESPSYHGYDVTDYRAIEPDYGTAADLEDLMVAAHDRGIDVIVDLVINHTSIDHPWFADARTPGSVHDDWYVWSTDGVPFAGPNGQRLWHPDGNRRYYAYFWEGMPDLNLASPEVTSELDAIARFWLDEMGVDGFRLDAARHLIEDGSTLENTPATFEWLAGFRERIKGSSPDALVLGEVWDATSMASRYVREGALDLTFDFGLGPATIEAIRSGGGASLRAANEEAARSYPPNGLATFLTNHDQDRVATELGADVAAEKLAATLLLTGQGVPFMYYGEEIGLTGSKPDERIRTPLRWDTSAPAAGFSSAAPWEALSEDPAATNIATEASDPNSLLSTYRSLVHLRHEHPALGHGDWTPIDSSSPAVHALVRHADGESVVVMANLGEETAADVALDLATGPLCGTPNVEVLLGPGGVRTPTVTSTGGFDGYVPVDRLEPRETIVIGLAS